MIEPQLRRREAWLRSRWFLLIPALTVLLPLLQIRHNPIYQVAGLTGIHVGIALFVARAVRMQSRVLNWGPIVWLGTLSYSFYLWQATFSESRIQYLVDGVPTESAAGVSVRGDVLLRSGKTISGVARAPQATGNDGAWEKIG